MISLKRYPCIAVLLLLVAVPAARAETFEIWPSTGDCSEEFENVANGLQPGDELILHGGLYSQNCKRSLQLNGTAQAPIIIRAADGESPLLTNGNGNNNNIEIQSSSHLIIRGLRFQGGSTGMRFIGGNNITVEDCEIFETGNNAVAMNSGNSDSMIFRRNHIHHTGLVTNEGEGFYVGCNWDNCYVNNSLFEGNYIHHLRGNGSGGNDGIEIKVGSHGNIIRNNVIHDTNIGTEYPCIFVYGGGPEVNIVEGNVVWNCGEGIQVVSDAVVRNNIFLNSNTGILATPHVQVSEMRNVTIVNNTIYGNSAECLYMRWSGATNMTFANNAVYCPGGTALDGSGLGGAGITLDSNYVEGSMSGASIDGSSFLSGGSTAAAFVDAAARHLWPAVGSPLIDAASVSHVPPLDFNESLRGSPYDVGAYETDGQASNPGWAVVPGFKAQGPADETAPGVPQNLSATAQGQSSIHLDWTAATDPESGVSGYKVYRAGALIAQPGSPGFTDTGLVDATAYSYEVSAVNGAGLESGRSAPASATTASDTTPPGLVSVESRGTPTQVTVVFSEPLEQSSSTTASNYSIDNGVSVSSAVLASDLVTVTLTTSALTESVAYTLTVNNVRDRATNPNSIAPGTTAGFIYENIVTVEVRINGGGDDVEEEQSGLMDSSSSDLELAQNGSDLQTIGLRFQPSIPQGATIVTAYVQFKVDETGSSAASLVVAGQASDDAAAFSSSSGDVTSRPRTSASIPWAPDAWSTVGEAGPGQRTPNISSAIQEIVNRPGWVAGNSLVLFVSGSGTRTAESYNGDAGGAALLHVEYSPTAPPTDPPPAPTNLDVD
jgi:hypothetical protein